MDEGVLIQFRCGRQVAPAILGLLVTCFSICQIRNFGKAPAGRSSPTLIRGVVPAQGFSSRKGV